MSKLPTIRSTPNQCLLVFFRPGFVGDLSQTDDDNRSKAATNDLCILSGEISTVFLGVNNVLATILPLVVFQQLGKSGFLWGDTTGTSATMGTRQGNG